MPQYRIHRLKENPRESFRWAAHTGGLAVVKSRDYEAGEEINCSNPYECWKVALERACPLHPGDLLQPLTAHESSVVDGMGELLIVKYIGFEPARWFVPEARGNPTAPEAPPPELVGTPVAASL